MGNGPILPSGALPRSSGSGFRKATSALVVLLLVLSAAVVFVTVPVAHAATAATVVQQANTGSASGQTSYSVALPSDVTAGDVLVVGMAATTGNPGQISDTLSSTWGHVYGSTGPGSYVMIYSATLTASGSDTVSIQFSGTIPADMYVYEVAGISNHFVPSTSTGTFGTGGCSTAGCEDNFTEMYPISYPTGSFLLAMISDPNGASNVTTSIVPTDLAQSPQNSHDDFGFALYGVATSAKSIPAASVLGGTDPTGSWQMGFSAFQIATPTSTSVVCSPSPVTIGSTSTCTATVTGTSPTGLMHFTTSGKGTFTKAKCTLSSGSCSVNYTDTNVESSTITASYPGDYENTPSSGSASLSSSKSGTSTSVVCSPSSVSAGALSTCTATVTGSSPTGTVTFSTSSGTGTFTPSNGQCTLSSGACSVNYTDTTADNPTITASYGGDTMNAASSGTTNPTVSSVASATSVSCSPSPAAVDSTTTCTATVTGVSPTGTVTFSTSSGTGTFTPSNGQCVLSSGSCSVAYGDTEVGASTITASYGGDATNQVSSGTFSLTTSVLYVPPPPIPPSDTPSFLTLATFGGATVTGTEVGMLSPEEVVYNVPSINQTLMDQELSQGNFTLFPDAVTTCSTTIGGVSYVRVSGFSNIWWGGSSTNSTEFVLGGWESFLTSAAGWPAEPACT